MAVTVTKMFHGKQINAMLFNRYVVEPYKVDGLPWGNDDDWQTFLPFRRGDPHPRQDIYPGAICHGFQLHRRLNFTTLLCGVVFSSNYPYGGGPRARSTVEEGLLDVQVPVVTAMGNTTPPNFALRYVSAKRPAFTRVETRFMPSGAENAGAVLAASRGWSRAVFPMNGSYWIFTGPKISDDGVSLMRVSYKFVAPSGMKGGVGSGGNPYGADVSMPDLDPLEEWVVNSSLQVEKRTIAQLYVTPSNPLTALPSLYPLT